MAMCIRENAKWGMRNASLATPHAAARRKAAPAEAQSRGGRKKGENNCAPPANDGWSRDEKPESRLAEVLVQCKGVLDTSSLHQFKTHAVYPVPFLIQILFAALPCLAASTFIDGFPLSAFSSLRVFASPRETPLFPSSTGRRSAFQRFGCLFRFHVCFGHQLREGLHAGLRFPPEFTLRF